MMLCLPPRNMDSHLVKTSKMSKLLELVNSCYLTWSEAMATVGNEEGWSPRRLSVLKWSNYFHHPLANLFFLIL